jgi:hypothetical protein
MLFLNLEFFLKKSQSPKNNAPFKTFKKYAFGTIFLKNKNKLQPTWTDEKIVKF